MNNALKVWMVLVLGTATGCGGGDGGGSGGTVARASEAQMQAACDAVEACTGDAADGMDCADIFEQSVLGSACATAIETASCEDQEMSSPPFLEVCYPSCTEPSQKCTGGGDAVRTCTDFSGELRELVIRCEDVCGINNRPWSGECGSSYMGQEGPSGEEVCWCEMSSGS